MLTALTNQPAPPARVRPGRTEPRAAGLARLLQAVAATDYRFITSTPLTQQRVLHHRGLAAGTTLRDIVGLSLPFHSPSVATDLLALMDDAGVLSPSGDLLRSTVRISSINDDLFLHSAYPTIKPDAVFFGPDTYRFARFIQQTLRTGQPVYAHAGRIAAVGLIAIMEVNGAGSEAIQAWDPETEVLKGFRMIFEKQRILFAIGDAMRQRGVEPIGMLALMQLSRRQQRLIASYPPSN